MARIIAKHGCKRKGVATAAGDLKLDRLLVIRYRQNPAKRSLDKAQLAIFWHSIEELNILVGLDGCDLCKLRKYLLCQHGGYYTTILGVINSA